MTDFALTIRLVNSLFTLGLGLLLLYIYLFKKIRFKSLVAWSIAFILYGVQILARIWYPWNSIEVFILSIAMAFPLVLGTSNLMYRNRLYGTLVLVETVIITYLFYSTSGWYRFGAFALFGLMTVAVIHLRLIAGKMANRFILGWLTLFTANIIFVAIVNLEWLADLFAIPAKSILALGMLDQRFGKALIDAKRLSQAYELITGKE